MLAVEKSDVGRKQVPQLWWGDGETSGAEPGTMTEILSQLTIIQGQHNWPLHELNWCQLLSTQLVPVTVNSTGASYCQLNWCQLLSTLFHYQLLDDYQL